MRPTQVSAQEAPKNRTFRVGGLVQEGSVKRDGTQVNFVITDTAKTVSVRYEGILPDLFKEGKGVVAQGQLQGGVFVAREVLAWNQAGRVLSLFAPPPFAPTVGDVLRIQPGCDKRKATCQAVFGNYLNFRGEPFIPGALAVLETPA